MAQQITELFLSRLSQFGLPVKVGALYVEKMLTCSERWEKMPERQDKSVQCEITFKGKGFSTSDIHKLEI